MMVFLCVALLTHVPQVIVSSDIENIKLNLRPTFILKGTTFIKITTDETHFIQSVSMSKDGEFVPTTMFSKLKNGYRINKVTDSLHNTTFGCMIRAFNSSKDSIFRRMFVIKAPSYIPILSFPESLKLDEFELVKCTLKEIVRPKPELIFVIESERAESVLCQMPKHGSVCNYYGHLKYLKRRWYHSEIQCCITSQYFKEKCSPRKGLNLLFLPKYVTITYTVLEQFATYAVFNFTCTIVSANPLCNIVWVDDTNVTDNGKVVIARNENGIDTSMYKILSLPPGNQEIVCQSECLLFNGTEENRIHVSIIPIMSEIKAAGKENLSKLKSAEKIMTVYACLSTAFCLVLVFIMFRRSLFKQRLHNAFRRWIAKWIAE